MSHFVQVHHIFIICYIGLTTGTPIFQGLKVQRGFEIEFKPFTFKPLTFFREKWSPLGVFGARKGIQKRELSTKILVNPAPPLPSPPAPVHEAFEEVVQQPIPNFQTPFRPLAPGPDPVNPGNIGPIIRPPPTGPESVNLLPNRPPLEGFYTNIGRVPVSSNLIESLREVFGAINGELPPRPIGPLGSGAPLPLQLAGPLQQPTGSIQQPIGPLPPISHQPINPVQPIQVPPMNVVPLITPPVPIPAPTPLPPEIPPKEGPLVKGSRIAMYLGSALMKMVSQFLANAKLQLSQFAAPPAPNPVPPAPLPAVPVMPLLN